IAGAGIDLRDRTPAAPTPAGADPRPRREGGTLLAGGRGGLDRSRRVQFDVGEPGRQALVDVDLEGVAPLLVDLDGPGARRARRADVLPAVGLQSRAHGPGQAVGLETAAIDEPGRLDARRLDDGGL